MDFILENVESGYEEGFRELLMERGYHCNGGIPVLLKIGGGKEISIEYSGKKAVIEAGEKTFLFRGLMTLVMHLEKNGGAQAFSVRETVHFDKNGAMLDCSRNCVMSLPAVKAWIRMQAAVGMNQLMLYTEDTYEVPEYPYFGAMRGRYKKEELQEIDQYACIFGIELIPCIQTLGHLLQPLRWEAMKGLRDTSDILMVGDAKVYEFLRACLKQVSECFTTRKIHLGMDEAWTLGLGNYLVKNGFHTKEEIMKEHLARVMELCREFGLEPMIWSDMYFRVHSQTEDYYNVPFDTDMTKKELPPKEMSLVYWDYYHTDESFYRGYLKLHRQMTERIWFAGGGWTWNGMVPNLKGAEAVAKAGLGACLAEGVRQVVYTLWGDDGTETPVFSALGPVLLCAEYGFGRMPTEESIREKFEFLTGYSYDAYRVLGDFDIWEEQVQDGNLSANPSKNLFYQDVLMGIYDGQMENMPVGKYYAGLEEKIRDFEKGYGRENNGFACGFWADEMGHIMDYYKTFARVLSRKADLGLRIRDAYLSGDRDTLSNIQCIEIPGLIRDVKDCQALRRQIWMAEGRIWGWEILDIRFYALIGRMESSALRIGQYLDGIIPAMPELEEARLALLPSCKGEKRFQGEWNSWVNTVSASPLAWLWLPQ